MSIHIVCPECQSRYTVTDELRGKKARCKKCGAAFLIEPEAEAATPEPPEKRQRPEPVRERYEDDDDRPRRKKSPRERKRASALVPLTVVGGAILIVLAFVGAGIGVWKYKQAQRADAVANAPATRSSPDTTTPTTPPAPAKPFWHAALPLHEGKVIAGVEKPEFGDLPEQAAAEEDAEAPPRPRGKPKEGLASGGGQMSPDVLLKVKRATFYIRVTFADGRRGTGSAFLIDDAGTVVTNAHVLGMLEDGSKKPNRSRSSFTVANSKRRSSTPNSSPWIGRRTSRSSAFQRLGCRSRSRSSRRKPWWKRSRSGSAAIPSAKGWGRT